MFSGELALAFHNVLISVSGLRVALEGAAGGQGYWVHGSSHRNTSYLPGVRQWQSRPGVPGNGVRIERDTRLRLQLIQEFGPQRPGAHELVPGL